MADTRQVVDERTFDAILAKKYGEILMQVRNDRLTTITEANNEAWAFMRRNYVIAAPPKPGGTAENPVQVFAPPKPDPGAAEASSFKGPGLLSSLWMGLQLMFRKDEIMSFSWTKTIVKGLKGLAIAAGGAALVVLSSPSAADIFKDVPVVGGLLGGAFVFGMTAALNWYKNHAK
jgi:hypothetical protein